MIKNQKKITFINDCNDEYSEYGMDDIANDLISIQAALEVVRLKMQYAMVKGE